MLRIGSKLHGYAHVQIRVASVPSITRVRFQTTSVPPPPPESCPPPVKKKSVFRRIIAPAVILGSVGAILFAKANNGFREKLVYYLPFSDEIIKVLFQEERSHGETVKSDVLDRWFGVKPESPLAEEAAKVEAKPAEDQCKPSGNTLRSTVPLESLAAFRDEATKESDRIVQFHKEMKELLARYTCGIINVTDNSAEVLEPDLSAYFTEHYGTLLKQYAEVESSVRSSKEKIAEIRAKMRESKFGGAKDIVDGYKKIIDDAYKTASEAHKSLLDERLFKNIVDKAFVKLNTNRKNVLEEVNALFPNLNIPEKVTTLRPDEVDLFLVYTALQVDRFRSAVETSEALREVRISRYLKDVQGELGEEELDRTINERVQNERRKTEGLYERKLSQLKSQCEKEVAKHLARQVEVHLASLKDIQTRRAGELRAQYSDERDETLKAVRQKNVTSLAEMNTELDQLDELFKSRTDKDFSAHRSQGLWGAGWAVARALAQVMPLSPRERKLAVLKQEVEDLTKASVGGDELVAAVVRSIPPEAKERGIFTQEALIDRFDKVAKVALVTALVPEDGGPLPLYLLSWIQSWFLCVGSDLTPSPLKSTVNTATLNDNTAIIREARYWLERGDLITALRYMNNLKGYSRRVAVGWITETTKHLETQQAADVIMAHAVARGML